MIKRFNSILLVCLFSIFFILTSCNISIKKDDETKEENNNTNESTNDNETQNDNYYIITFKDYDGKILKTNSIKEGDLPSYNELNPKRENDEEYSYVFSGWIPTIEKVNADTTYTATYTRKELPYNVTIDLNGGSTFSTKLQFKTDKVTKDLLPFDLEKEDYLFKGYEVDNVLVFDEFGNAVSDFTETANMTFKAKWILYKDTKYIVEHYLQNIDDNNYPKIPYEVDTLTGKNDTLTNALAKTYQGFTSPSINQVNISSDGSTIIKLYYTRNSYSLTTIINDEDAGSIKNVSGIYKYGQTIKIEGKANDHYTFHGWYKDKILYSPFDTFDYEMEASNVVLEAICTINSYQIIVYNNARGVKISGISSGYKYEYNKEITLTATNIPSGHIIYFERSDGEVYVGDNYVFNVPGENITITVSFRPYTRDNNKIYFGSYPQRLVDEDNNKDLIDELNALASDKAWISYDYYLKDQISDYMCYIDIDYDNNGTYDYRGVYFTKYRTYNISNINPIKDNTYQDDNGYFINTKYWFSYDPIEWDILNEKDGKALIIANLILDSQEYCNYDLSDPTEHNGGIGYSNNYELSNIRKWLNDYFYNHAFNSLEKSIIEKTTVDNSASSTASNDNIYACNNTKDCIFLLSYKEATTYYKDNQKRKTQGTDYAKCQGLCTLSGELGNIWWLRSPYYSLNGEVSRVNNYGSCTNYSSVTVTRNGVRPACYITL